MRKRKNEKETRNKILRENQEREDESNAAERQWRRRTWVISIRIVHGANAERRHVSHALVRVQLLVVNKFV